jgi:transcriptional regulator of heat shock response
VHTSSGRVPTQQAFRHYTQHLDRDEIIKNYIDIKLLDAFESANEIDTLLERTLQVLSDTSGYTSLVGVWGSEERFFFRGTRFILEQPEFEDIDTLKDLFYALEVKIEDLHNLLFSCIDQDLKIMVGDEMGCKEISRCSMLISGIKEKELSVALALLGPMRMNYAKAYNSLYSIKNSLQDIIRDLL